jgi:choline kinase
MLSPIFTAPATQTPRANHIQTLTYPKPLVEFANKPMIQHQIEALAGAGVTDIVLAVNYRPEVMAEALKSVRIPPNCTISAGITFWDSTRSNTT